VSINISFNISLAEAFWRKGSLDNGYFDNLNSETSNKLKKKIEKIEKSL
jgi:hypothetical protein